jgi:hypothetical protein
MAADFSTVEFRVSCKLIARLVEKGEARSAQHNKQKAQGNFPWASKS